jgi:hypothetical protein
VKSLTGDVLLFCNIPVDIGNLVWQHTNMNKTHKTHGLTETALRRMYQDELLSDAEIGKRYGLTDVAISYYRRKYVVPTISARERSAARAKRGGLMDIRNVSLDSFRELCEIHGERALASMFGCSRQLVRTVRGEYSIGPTSKTRRNQNRFPEALTEYQKQVLFGSLLGDGCLSNGSCGSSRFKEGHSFHQVGYLRWKHSVFSPYSNRVKREDKLLDDGRIAYGYTFNTCFHGAFQNYYDSFYPVGEKRLPVDFESALTPLSLAVWYMDDGHLSDRTKDGVITIASGFPDDDIDRIVGHLNDLKLEAKARQYEDSVSIISIEDKRKFHDMVGAHIHPSMTYKVPGSLGGTPLSHDNTMFRASRDSSVVSSGELFDFLRRVGWSDAYCPSENLRIAMEKMTVGADSSCGKAECLAHFPAFWRLGLNGMSPVDAFNDDAILMATIKNCIDKGSVTDSDVRLDLASSYGVGVRSPVVVLNKIRSAHHGVSSVLDMDASYGEAMLAFCCSDASKYVGIARNKATVAGLKRLSLKLTKLVSGKEIRIVREPVGNCEGFDVVLGGRDGHA